MKRQLLIIAAAALVLLGGCGVQPTADGKIKDGGRVIDISSDTSDVHAYRGETVTLVYSDSGDVSLSVPDFEAEASGSDKVQVKFKAAKTGEYEITITANEVARKCKLIVEELAETNVFKSVDATAFKDAMTGDYLLLDVRSQEEYDSGHIEGARLIPVNELADRLDEVKGYNKALVYCASGNRSIAASQILIEAGFQEVKNLKGGFKAWQAEAGLN